MNRSSEIKKVCFWDMGLVKTTKQDKDIPLPRKIIYFCKKVLMNEEFLWLINKYTIQIVTSSVIKTRYYIVDFESSRYLQHSNKYL